MKISKQEVPVINVHISIWTQRKTYSHAQGKLSEGPYQLLLFRLSENVSDPDPRGPDLDPLVRGPDLDPYRNVRSESKLKSTSRLNALSNS
jgi:hypothetical protein